MSTLTLSDIASYESREGARRKPPWANRIERPPSRRTFLKASAAIGSGIALSALGALPPARRAFAMHPDEDEMAPNCSGLAFAEDDNCQGCEETTVHCCCDVSSHWHIHTDSGSYVLRPNECRDAGSSTDPYWDGWYWERTTCCGNGLGNQRWRCHDGKRRLASGSYEDTVCKYRTNATPC